MQTRYMSLTCAELLLILFTLLTLSYRIGIGLYFDFHENVSDIYISVGVIAAVPLNFINYNVSSRVISTTEGEPLAKLCVRHPKSQF